jgi:hypothetical protein
MLKFKTSMKNILNRFLLLNPSLVLPLQRFYSTLDPKSSLLSFPNAGSSKLEILRAGRNHSGIYMWTNNLNGKKYVGSSVNLKRRFQQYFNVNRLSKDASMHINRALLFHGVSNFSLTILEFCDKDSLMAREKHYFNKYSPEYNILLEPGSPSRGSGWKHDLQTIEKIRLSSMTKFKSSEYLSKISKAQSTGIKIQVTDITTNTITCYHAIRAAAAALNIDKRDIEHYIYLNKDKPFLNRYHFKLLSFKQPELKQNNVQKNSLKLEVKNISTNAITVYPSIGAAARSLGIRQTSISTYLSKSRTKPFKGIYLFKLI